ncbi:MAG: VTT domain-containing protein [bacterium]|jgi:membrane protein YqaA with SNARE-associated domain|nr:VTT domain-containing protein [bacterium]
MLRRLYHWVLHWADHRWAVPALALLAFAESSFFPVPPDVLLIALTLGRPRRAWWYAGVCSLGSVAGGVLGYLIGALLWEAVQGWFIPLLFSQEIFDHVAGLYGRNAFWAIFTAAFTPIPYKVFTIAAGVFHEQVALGVLVLASALGRPLRFFLVAGLLRFFGEPMKAFIERWFDWLALAFAVLLIGSFLLVKLIGG